MKFEVGNIVRIMGDSGYSRRLKIGTIGVISEIDNTAILLPYKVKDESSNQYWWYNENEIELIERKGE